MCVSLPSSMDVLFRVLVAAFVCVAPTVLFLGLWRGLHRMQDDKLVERIADAEGVTIDDLLPGTRPRTHELDSTERRTLQRMAMDGASSETQSESAPDDRERP